MELQYIYGLRTGLLCLILSMSSACHLIGAERVTPPSFAAPSTPTPLTTSEPKAYRQGYLKAQQRIQAARETQATTLDLQGLGLVKLPPEIGQLRHVQTIHLVNTFANG